MTANTPSPHSLSAGQSSPTRCVVADDHPVVRKGLVSLTTELGDLTVVGEAEDIASARSAVEHHSPDLLIIDLMLNKISAAVLIKELRLRFPALRQLVVSMMDETIYGPQTLQAGAHGFIMKGAPAAELQLAIKTVLNGGLYLNPSLATELVRNGPSSKAATGSVATETLSSRELEVFRLVGQGLTSKEIAGALSVSNRTIDAHKTNIRKKLNLPSAAALNRSSALWVQDVTF